jgi:hypothetical protein
VRQCKREKCEKRNKVRDRLFKSDKLNKYSEIERKIVKKIKIKRQKVNKEVRKKIFFIL